MPSEGEPEGSVGLVPLAVSNAAAAAAAAAGAMEAEPVADELLGIRSSQRRTAVMAVQPLFLTGSFSNC